MRIRRSIAYPKRVTHRADGSFVVDLDAGPTTPAKTGSFVVLRMSAEQAIPFIEEMLANAKLAAIGPKT